MRPVFYHNPRTAGTFILTSLRRSGVDFEVAVHDTDARTLEFYSKSTFLFSCVRNPIDRFVSAFCYLSGCMGESAYSNILSARVRSYGPDVNEFVEKCDDYARVAIHFARQVNLLSFEGRILPSFIMKYERVSKDVDVLFDKLGQRDTGETPEKLQSSDRSNAVLGERAISKLLEYYSEDFKAFEY